MTILVLAAEGHQRWLHIGRAYSLDVRVGGLMLETNGHVVIQHEPVIMVGVNRHYTIFTIFHHDCVIVPELLYLLKLCCQDLLATEVEAQKI